MRRHAGTTGRLTAAGRAWLFGIFLGFSACSGKEFTSLAGESNGSSGGSAQSGSANLDASGAGVSGSSDAALESGASGASGGTARGWLKTRGNKIYDADEHVFRARGANIHDTRSCNACSFNEPDVGEVKRRIDALVDDWHANFVRLLLESYGMSGGRLHFAGPTADPAYLEDIVEIVDYIGTKPGVYVLVSLWLDPTFSSRGAPTAATSEVWRTVAGALIGKPYVLFGLANEPAENFDGATDGAVWNAMNDTALAIREVEAERGSQPHVIVVQGTRGWGRDLGYYVTHPIEAGARSNIAYETHAFSKPGDFAELWATPSDTLPVIIGEFGPSDLGDGTSMTLADTTALMNQAEERDIPWLAWTFHMRCPPSSLLTDDSSGGCGQGMALTPSPWGLHIKNRLAAPWRTR